MLKRKLFNYIVKKEGGQKTSITLRKAIMKKHKVKIGLYTYGSCFDEGFNTGGSVDIGAYCSFGPEVRYFGANHPIERAVMSAYFYNKSFSGLDVRDVERHHLTIGNDVWIGRGTTILSTCSQIGNGAVIGAGAIVTKDVPAYAIVVGSPAKVLRYRFSEDICDLLENSKWWNLSPEELMTIYDSMFEPLMFAKKAKGLIHEKNKA